MCGRYQRRADKQRIAEAFALGRIDGLSLELAPNYNAAPQTMQPVVVWDDVAGTRTLQMMFWISAAVLQRPENFQTQHNQRGPLIVDRTNWQRWLQPSPKGESPVNLLQPFDAIAMKAWRANPRINSVRNNDAHLADAVAEEGVQFSMFS